MTVIAIINVFRLKDPDLRQRLIALTCGYFGIIFASYGNQILGQMPTGPIVYFTMVYMFFCRKWDKEIIEPKDLCTIQNQAIERLVIKHFKVGNRLEKRVKMKVV